VDATGQPRSGAESPSWRPWSLPAGRRAPGRSAAAKTPTPARNCRSPTPTGTASKSSHRPARPDLAALELRHRQRARVEDRIRGAKATGLRNLPFDRWRRNAVWLELVLMACWTQALLLDGELAVCEPKALRYRLLHVAARISRHARRLIVRLQHLAVGAHPGRRVHPPAGTAAALLRLRRSHPVPGRDAPAGWHTRGVHDRDRATPPTAPRSRCTSRPPRRWTVTAPQPTLPCTLDRPHQRLMKSRG
jgi:hypothetical protein